VKYLEPYGQVVVPIGGDGKPRGSAFWCETSKEALQIVAEEGGPSRATYVSMYREQPPKKD